MREIVTKVYLFDELSDEAKKKAIEAHRFDFAGGWDEANWDSIKAIANACNMDIISSHYNDTGFANFELQDDINNFYDVIALNGSRAIAYIYNNWIKPNTRGKYYATKGKWIDGIYTQAHTRSKCTFEFSCPFTGYYLDDCLLEAYKKFCECVRIDPRFDISDFVDILSERVNECLQNDYDCSISDECVVELLAINNYEFSENGKDFLEA